MSKVIYGHVESVEDIKKINKLIRLDMRKTKSRPQLTELVKRSQYLYTLTHSPVWKKSFGKKVNALRRVARSEYLKTCKLANAIAKMHGWKADYGP